jgi:hypothetical protein
MGILVLVEKIICNVKHLEKFPNVFGGHLTPMTRVSLLEKRRDLMPTYRCEIAPTLKD